MMKLVKASTPECPRTYHRQVMANRRIKVVQSKVIFEGQFTEISISHYGDHYATRRS